MKMKGMISLRKVTSENKRLFRRLFDYYCHDLACFYDDKEDCKLTDSGTYKYRNFKIYYTHAGLKTFLIYSHENIVGFVVISRPPYFSKDKKTSQVVQFFVLNGYRRGGIGTEVINRVFLKYPGKYAVSQLVRNKPAIAFWRSFYKKSRMKYTEKVETFETMCLRVQRFTVPKRK